MTAIIDYFKKMKLYRLTLYCMVAIYIYAIIVSNLGLTQYRPMQLIIALVAVVSVGVVANYLLAKIFGAKSNIESVLITLIILLLIFPIGSSNDIVIAVLAGVLAIASKYLLTAERRHIFNPVALSAVAISYLYTIAGATWWVGTPHILPMVVLAGLLIVWKMRAWKMVGTFIITIMVCTIVSNIIHPENSLSILSNWQFIFAHSAFLFFAFIMLTEPLTAPSIPKNRIYFAILVGLLYSTIQLKVAQISLTPEMALVFGNIYAYLS
ncbi:MAG: RnfABCDGE type electron transport complex subunit D, partial [bacterium]